MLITKPDINVYEAFRDIEGLKGLQVLIVQEVRTSEALIYVFKTTVPLSAGTAENMFHVPGVWSINANMDGPGSIRPLWLST